MTGNDDAASLGSSHGQILLNSSVKPPPKASTSPLAVRKPRSPTTAPGSTTRRRGSVDFSSRADEIDGMESPHDNEYPTHQSRKAALHARSCSPTGSPRTRRSSSVTAPPSGESANVRVMVRVRPFSDEEVKQVEDEGGYMQSVIDMPRKDQVLLLDHTKEYDVVQGFNFDDVFWSCTQQRSNVGFHTQEDVYNLTGIPALSAAWEGINTCIFAYGQTGSGKTHTMMGDPSQIAEVGGCEAEQLGVIPRLCRQLYDEIAVKGQLAMDAGMRKKTEVKVRFMEIYNEKVKDLLVNHNKHEHETFRYAGAGAARKLDPEDLKIREHPTDGPYVEGISIFTPTSFDEIMELINIGNQERSVATTRMNDRSSRSHAIFRITVTQTNFLEVQRQGIGGPKTTTHIRQANINLVDLAGSENVKRSGASGSVLLEAQKINLSLTTLRRVIDALIEKKPKGQVPYRESTLTWLLREDLGGNAKTFMLATVSPHHSNAHESLRTLEYAMRARSIVNNVRVNEDETAKLLADLEKKMKETAQAMATVSAEEREELEMQMKEAEKARDELNSRLEEAAAEATEYKSKLEAEKERNMAFAFRNAVMLRATKARLRKSEALAQEQQMKLDRMDKTMREVGHDNVDDLACSLSKERVKVNELLQAREELEKHRQEMDREHQALREQLRKELAEKEQIASTAADVGRETVRRDIQHKMKLSAIKARLEERYDALVQEHEEQMKKMKESHDKELMQILEENQSVADEYEKKIRSLHGEINEMSEQNQKRVRILEQESQQVRRNLQDDITKREKLIDKLEAELAAATRERDEMRRKLRAQEEQAELNKRLAIEDVQKHHDQHVEEIRNKHALEWSKLAALHDKAEEDVNRALKEKAEVQKMLAHVEKQEKKYEQTFDVVSDFLDKIPNGEIPASWTLDNVREMIKAFQAFKQDYSSYRPNRETLRHMLRIDPARPSASRMREMLNASQEDQNGVGMHTILEGIRCPEIGGTVRLESVLTEPDVLHTEADSMPVVQDVKSARDSRNDKEKNSNSRRRTRSNPKESKTRAQRSARRMTSPSSKRLSSSMSAGAASHRSSKADNKSPTNHTSPLNSSSKKLSASRRDGSSISPMNVSRKSLGGKSRDD